MNTTHRPNGHDASGLLHEIGVLVNRLHQSAIDSANQAQRMHDMLRANAPLSTDLTELHLAGARMASTHAAQLLFKIGVLQEVVATEAKPALMQNVYLDARGPTGDVGKASVEHAIVQSAYAPAHGFADSEGGCHD